MKTFVVEGKMTIAGRARAFVKEIPAESEARARELTYQRLGADHKLARSRIAIGRIAEMRT